jgi:hypothetical protein
MPFTTERKFVARAEQELGRRLPRAYVNRLLRSNGGSVEIDGDEWVLHPVRDDSDRKKLSRTCNDIVRETRAAREWKDFPLSAVAIGANGLGDLLLLMAENDEQFAEAIYVWRHETGQLHEVAPGFAAIEDE